jgi:hypothetical protein
MKLLSELTEDVKNLVEANESGVKSHYISGIFMQGAIKNRNGRVYPTSILENEVNRYSSTHIAKNRAMGELNHPSGPTINLDRVSHVIKELRREGDNFIGKAKILDTPMGIVAKNLIDEGIQLGVSSRGLGSVRSVGGINEVQNDFHLATVDIVADPSAHEAFVEGLHEGAEWIWENGVYRQQVLEDIKKETNKKSLTESELLNAWSRFLASF